MGKALLSNTGHTEGPTQPLLLNDRQENSMSSSVCGRRLHGFLQICFSLLISAYRFPRCPAVKEPQETLPKRAAPALQHPMSLSSPKVHTYLP